MSLSLLHLTSVLGSLLAFSATVAPAQGVAPSPGASTAAARRVTLTYLKAKPGRLAALERFVRANWFEMDEAAVRQGLFVSYEWLDSGRDDGAWNAIVMVTYRDASGFSGIEAAWAPIRAGHREVRPDGFGITDLGKVVESQEVFERAPFVAKRPARPVD